jgi:hypothetical protein
MSALKDDQSVVIDRELDHDNSLDPAGTRIRCPLSGFSPSDAEAPHPAANSGEVGNRMNLLLCRD